MVLNDVDRRLEDAELDAASPTSTSRHHDFPQRRSEEIERVISASSVSTVSSTGPTHRGVGVGMSRVSTQRDLERHPTELSRIQTQKSQHSATVGRDFKSRRSSRASLKPLPNFGAGKPYPPLLPNQEDFVVEFDGPDDLLHPLNWSLRKKYDLPAPFSLKTLGTNTMATQSSYGRYVGLHNHDRRLWF